MANLYLNIMDKFNKALYLVISLMILGIFVVIFLQVIFRYVLSNSLSWTDEAARYLMVWSVFIGASICARQGSLIAVEAIVQAVPEKIKIIMQRLAIILSILFCAPIIYYGIEKASYVAHQNSMALLIPMWIPYAAIPVGMLLITLNLIAVLIETFKKKPVDMNNQFKHPEGSNL